MVKYHSLQKNIQLSHPFELILHEVMRCQKSINAFEAGNVIVQQMTLISNC